MKNFTTIFSPAIVVLAVLCACAQADGAAITTIKVSDSREFLEALGSDRIIEMAPGVYNLSQWDPILNNHPEQAPPYPGLGFLGEAKLASGVTWQEVFDGGELTLNGVKNLTIRGWTARGGFDESEGIVVDPRYAFVLKFVNCSDIVIENLKAGHSEGGYCDGGVFGFADSSRIEINRTEMYGCGTVGLELWDVSDMKVTDSWIYECTDAIMMVRGGKNIAFEECVFRHNLSSWIGVFGTENMSFADCEIYGNSGYAMFGVNDTVISVSNSTFSGNATETPIQNSENVEFVNCVFEEGGAGAR